MTSERPLLVAGLISVAMLTAGVGLARIAMGSIPRPLASGEGQPRGVVTQEHPAEGRDPASESAGPASETLGRGELARSDLGDGTHVSGETPRDGGPGRSGPRDGTRSSRDGGEDVVAQDGSMSDEALVLRPDLRLVGIIAAADGGVAVVEANADPPRPMTVGDVAAAYTLTAIDSVGVVFTNPSDTIRLTLLSGGSGSGGLGISARMVSSFIAAMMQNPGNREAVDAMTQRLGPVELRVWGSTATLTHSDGRTRELALSTPYGDGSAVLRYRGVDFDPD